LVTLPTPSGDVVIVDWLGRGGIAQTSEAWAIELRSHGVSVAVATRPGRELHSDMAGDNVAGPGTGRIAAHREVVRQAVRLIEVCRPGTVVIQNYVLPPLERPVFEAARRVGARLVLVVHDHRLHTVKAGTNWGLKRAIRRCDVVVAHSDYVANAVERLSGRADVMRFPLPVQVGMVDCRMAEHERPHNPGGPAVASHFGVLRRGYKGTNTVIELARAGVPGWKFRLVGVKEPMSIEGAEILPGFVPAAELVDAVRNSDATLLPYRFATQSGAAVLAQALGSVVVTTRVGGIPEQVEDGVTGRVLSPDAPLNDWRAALAELADAGTRAALRDAAMRRVWEDHEAFSAAVTHLVGSVR